MSSFVKSSLPRVVLAVSILSRAATFVALMVAFTSHAFAQQTASPAKSVESITAEMNQAIRQVQQIVNEPVTPIRRTPGMRVSTVPTWFHEGATKPDFNTIDVQKTQDLLYAQSPYMASANDPNLVYPGKDLEFNSMTKYFYTDRSVPKKRLSEPEMQAINRLYRIIGRCEGDLQALKSSSSEAESDDGSSKPDLNTLIPRLPVSPFVERSVLVVLLLLVGTAMYRAFKKPAG